MTIKQHKFYFVFIFLFCALLIIFLNKPINKFIPLIWTLLGFGFYFILFLKSWIDLSLKLISEFYHDLIKLKVDFTDNKIKSTVNIFDLIQKKNQIDLLDFEIKGLLNFCLNYLLFAALAFIGLILLCFLTLV
jgi:hypothetical protein